MKKKKGIFKKLRRWIEKKTGYHIHKNPVKKKKEVESTYPAAGE